VLGFRYGDLYNEENLAISGTHTHAGPGGYLQYVVYSVTSLGFVRQSFDAIVNAIEQCIVQAHNNLKPGSIFINKGEESGLYTQGFSMLTKFLYFLAIRPTSFSSSFREKEVIRVVTDSAPKIVRIKVTCGSGSVLFCHNLCLIQILAIYLCCRV